MARSAFVVGGTGQIGYAVANHLLDRGWEVTLSARGGRPAPADLVERGATVVALDREESGALARALRHGADAVIDTLAYHVGHADQLLELQDSVAAFAVISSASVYCDDAGRSLGEGVFEVPITEAQATVEPGDHTYATRKVALEQRLLQAATTPVTILRPCAIHGVHSRSPREWWFVKRMLDGRPVIPLDHRGEARFHTTAAVNLAALISAALEAPARRVLNSADPIAPTTGQIGAVIAQRLAYEGQIRAFDLNDDNRPGVVADTPWSCASPFVLDLSAGESLGHAPIGDYETTVAPAIDGLVANKDRDWKTCYPGLAAYPVDLFDYAGEDAFLATTGGGDGEPRPLQISGVGSDRSLT
jgi:nucleoside-diphosphate-sugar epimerase